MVWPFGHAWCRWSDSGGGDYRQTLVLNSRRLVSQNVGQAVHAQLSTVDDNEWCQGSSQHAFTESVSVWRMGTGESSRPFHAVVLLPVADVMSGLVKHILNDPA